MVDTSKLDEFLKPEMVANGDELHITGGGELVVFKKGEKDEQTRLQILVQLKNGDLKKFTLNNTNRRTLSDAWGAESDDWIGKTAIVNIGVTNIGGTVRKVIYLMPK